jgi:SAM-dependent methyltransferase
MDQANCLLCGAVASARPWFIKTTTAAEYPIVRCAVCRSAFVWPRPDSGVIAALYASEVAQPNGKAKGVYLPSAEADARRLFRTFSSSITHGWLLDIGAGEGVASAEAVRRGFKVRACEPSPRGAKLFAQRLGFEPDRTFFDIDYAEKNCGNFNVALLSHVLEHIPDPDLFVRNICTILKPGGAVVIAVPLFGSILTLLMGKNDFFVTPPVHLTYFSLDGLAGLLSRNGFEVVASYTSPKVNMERYRSSLGPMRYAVNIGAYLALGVSEMFHRSVVLNVCATRT